MVSCHVFIIPWLPSFRERYLFLFPGQVEQRFKKHSQSDWKTLRTLELLLTVVNFISIHHWFLKNSWSNYKQYNAVTLLVGITPTGVISFIPPLWTGSTSDEEMVRNSGLIDCLKEGDAVMADKGFLVRDLLVFKKIQLISPAYCRRPRLSSKAVIYTQRIA